jgi:uncharacterized protein YkwD
VAALLAPLPPAPARATTSYERSMLYLVNRTRESYGRERLRISESLSDIARAHSRRMAWRGSIYEYPNLPWRLRNYDWDVVGSNVGAGPSLRRIHDAFMRSAEHRGNVLLHRFHRIGIGIVYAHGRYWVTEIFLG